MNKNDSNCISSKEKLHRAVHWGPLIALFIIFYIALVSLRSSIWMSPPSKSIWGLLQIVIISTLLYLIIASYFSALFTGPGFVPLRWKPTDPQDRMKLQYCQICEGYKPPRSHHCSTCKRCVMKMDHHCPWINTCCGHANHGHFIQFLLFVPMGCSFCVTVLVRAIYHGWKNMMPYIIQSSMFTSLPHLMFNLFMMMFACGLAFGVTVAVGILAFVQLRSVWKNVTGIENWILTKANYWRKTQGFDAFLHPYDLGWKQNLSQVLTWSGVVLGDGIDWPLRDGCGRHDLTLEQIRQKQMKKINRREYKIVRAYSGRYCPCEFGCRVACCTPYPDESRLTVQRGDTVFVYRIEKHWLYGHLEPQQSESANGYPPAPSPSDRGWFPRICAVDVHPHPNGTHKCKQALKED